MAEENDKDEERSLDPTERRLQKAREEGQLPQSRDLTTFAMLAVVPMAFLAFGPLFMDQMVRMVKGGLTFGDPNRILDDILLWGSGSLLAFCGVLLLIVIPLWVISFLSPLTLVAFRPYFVFKFNGNRLDPISGMGRMFSVNTLVELLKNIFKASLLLSVGLTYMVGLWGSLTMIANQDLNVAFAESYRLIIYGFLFLLIPMILIAFGDTFFQWFNFRKQMRMSQEEMKQEIKESEGSPEMRARIRQKQRQLSTSRMMAAIEKADVVLANPEHYSVAIRYDQEKMAAPVVVAKGSDDIALRIQDIAKDHQVPIARIPPLARLMYSRLEIGEAIPFQLFEAVAKVLAWAYEMKQEAGSLDLPDVGPLPDLEPTKFQRARA
ncbi:flagellar biosynthesis protein FlhB [Polynucleobacter sp. AP-Kolm-20A-A1]|uniref:EscU/YscU/HrcU family type III secretion system export apparatus switch protein n=1 Tax=Polynucleobacter sp. AP-Kolm-20A-A1 TaxID=2081041 RepID=UPI001BFD162F|nr:EscU/YscU/HrcU family type III secretion system export apparatus switch protein [Polynucleobacter sp. AP-Kolm-20A-A1]QWE19921.1 EscU/YscU/HrcU family type III secretion system export apparatus switch protein [Polynucleobacter sp. AP-Kolm-20A-A1]